MFHEASFKMETLDIDGAEEIFPAYDFLLIRNTCLVIICLSILCATQRMDEGLIILLANQGCAI